MKPGYKTTEFYFALFTAAATVFSRLQGLIDSEAMGQLLTAVSGLYGIARGFAKFKNPA